MPLKFVFTIFLQLPSYRHSHKGSGYRHSHKGSGNRHSHKGSGYLYAESCFCHKSDYSLMQFSVFRVRLLMCFHKIDCVIAVYR